ncbi:MAG: hypothetical protein IJB74_08815 [Clostridia bacterium]|nr:hypothetical protein [Clostridia bacterium]
MFLGTFEHTLDGKNRVILPVKFRKELGEEFICKFHASKYPSIQLFNAEEFEQARKEALLRARSPIEKRNILAQFHLGTDTASCDAQGRVILNQMITEIAEIEKTCIFVGFGEHVEVMSPANYKKYLASITANNVADEQALEDEMTKYREHQANGDFLNLG